MIRLAPGFHSHPKVIEAGDAAIGLYCRALSYCWDHNTDGRIPHSFLKNKLKTAERLVLFQLFDRDDQGYSIHDYLERNYSREQRRLYGESRRAGGVARWQHDASKVQASSEQGPLTGYSDIDIDSDIDKRQGRRASPPTPPNPRRVHSLTDRAKRIEEDLKGYDPASVFADRKPD